MRYLQLLGVVGMLIASVPSYTQTSNLTCYLGNTGAINEVVNQRVFTNITIPQTDSIKGYLEHLPAGYNENDANTKYPVIIVLHVYNEAGNGTAEDMCKFFANRYQLFPYTRIELGGWPTTLPTGVGENTPFITLTPQFVSRTYSIQTLDGYIEYIKQTYHIDERKIYLLGTSQGANVALQYVGGSDAYAKKIAGVLALSPCHNLLPVEVQNIKNNNVGVWNLQCSIDKTCETEDFPLENDTIAAYNNYNKLAAAGMDPQRNVLSHTTPDNGCNGNPHDTWTPTLNTNFTFSTLSTPQNVYQWLGPLTNNQILPVRISDYNIIVQPKQVTLQWTTHYESNGKLFYIQRAGENLVFTNIDSIQTKNIETGSNYTYTDKNPLSGNSYYRLVQNDLDGNTQTFEIKKVSIIGNNSITLLSNPFQNQVSFIIQTQERDQFQILLRDVNGKTYYTDKIEISTGSKTIQIKDDHIPAGMYILSIHSKAGLQTHKLIKQ